MIKFNDIKNVLGKRRYSTMLLSIARSFINNIKCFKRMRETWLIKRKILKSNLFDNGYYLENNPDVAASGLEPLEHYLIYGGNEGRNPGPVFNSNFYLNENPDVKCLGINPLLHYIKYGKKEGRAIDRSFKFYYSIKKEDYLKQKKSELFNFLSGSEILDFVSPEPKISIILVLFNKAELTYACLRSLKQNAGLPLEIIIVDNHSTDFTYELLNNVKVSEIIYNNENLHFITACNQALEYVSSRTVLFLNNDTEIEEGSLSSALESLYQRDNIGAVGAKLVLPNGRLQEAGNIIWNDGSCLGYGRGRSPFLPEYNFKRIVDYCSGAFLLTRTELIKKHGGFDLRFLPAYYEETDYCLWLQENGYDVVYDPNVRIKHFEFGSSSKEEGTGLQNINRKKFVEKHSHQLKKHFKPDESNILHARFAASQQDKRKILYIEDRVPHPTLGTGLPRSLSIIKILEELGCLVTIYPNTFPCAENLGEIYKHISPFIEVAIELGISRFSQFLEKRKEFYDIIWVTRPHNMKTCKESLLKYNPNYDIIYDAEAIFAEREIRRQKILNNAGDVHEFKRMIDEEIDLCSFADTIVAVSETDASKFIDHGIKKVKVVGHTLRIHAGKNDFNDRQDMLFVGNLDYDESPNADSIVWFVNEVLPIIRKDIPEIQLHIVGSNKAPSIQKINAKGVQIHGKVIDLKKYYDNCRIFIAPTRFAAGIPYKVHEAASFGIPVVATDLLVNQLGWSNNKHILSSEIDKYSFSSAVINLYKDETLWKEIRSNALKIIEKDFSRTEFKKVIFDTLQSLSNQQM